MNRELIEKLRKVDFSACLSKSDVWKGVQSNIEGLNSHLRASVLGDLANLESGADAKILGKIFLGEPGVGKTHFLASLRENINATFVYADMTGISDFWQTLLYELLTSLTMKVNGREQNLSILSAFLSENEIKNCEKYEQKVMSKLYEADSDRAMKSRDVLRAFLLFCSGDMELKFIGSDWLHGLAPHEEARKISFGAPKGNARDVVLALAWFASFRGPTLFAIDQIDMIASDMINVASASEKRDSWLQERIEKNRAIVSSLMNDMASLVMDAPRSLVLLACLNSSLKILKENALASSLDRFDTQPPILEKLSSLDSMLTLVGTRISHAVEKKLLPHPSFPFKKEFFEKLEVQTPRKVLQLCERSLRNTLEMFDKRGEFQEISAFSEHVSSSGELNNVEENFTKNMSDDKEAKTILDANDIGEERIGNLLHLACLWFVEENDLHERVVIEKMDDKKNPALHSRVIATRSDKSEVVFCLRSLLPTHYATFRSRFEDALRASGINFALDNRRLAIFSKEAFPKWPSAKGTIKKFNDARGDFFIISPDTLNVLLSLEKISSMNGFSSWLRTAKPIKRSNFFANLFDGIFAVQSKEETPPKPIESPGLLIGESARVPVHIKPNSLCEHTVILASSGSGKTVLLRRIIEQAALQNIPSIVIDAGNDLARLGTPSVETDDDDYFKKADVVVWTPGIKAGRGIVFAPLPDFAALQDDDSARAQAVSLAEDALSKIVAPGNSQKSRIKLGVLNSALQFFANGGRAKPKLKTKFKKLFALNDVSSRLADFIDLLEDLPEEAQIDIKDAGKYAIEMANVLRSERQRNPNFQDSPPFDIGELLSAKTPEKTRVSVINLSGLQSVEAQCSFINQLAVNLFLHIRKNPSKNSSAQAILAIDEAQDFLPAGASTTVCKNSLLRLVAQGRKYGLGLVLATQNPRNLDYKAMGNIGTYFLGRTQAPNTVNQLTELIDSWGVGGKRYSVGCLEKGEFFIRSTSGYKEPQKVTVSMCVSSHPTGETLTAEEIIKLSRK